MLEFDYSIDARNVLNKFYRVDKVVYVEGDDDIAFWEFLFDKFLDFTVEIESVGGKPELQKYAELIYSNKAEYLIAMDSDYDGILGFEYHPNIIRTYGYSIENTLINSDSICKIVKNVARVSSKNVPVSICGDWIENLSSTIAPLVLADLISTKEKVGVSVIPDNGDRFMKSKKTYELCGEKIQNFLSKLPIVFDREKLSKEETNLQTIGLSYADILKGHFLFSIAMRFIKVQAEQMNRGVAISAGMLYSNFISVFENVFNEDHPHFNYYKDSFSSIEVHS